MDNYTSWAFYWKTMNTTATVAITAIIQFLTLTGLFSYKGLSLYTNEVN